MWIARSAKFHVRSGRNEPPMLSLPPSLPPRLQTGSDLNIKIQSHRKSPAYQHNVNEEAKLY